MGEAPVEERLEVAQVEFYRLRVLLYGGLKLALLAEGVAPRVVVVRLGLCARGETLPQLGLVRELQPILTGAGCPRGRRRAAGGRRRLEHEPVGAAAAGADAAVKAVVAGRHAPLLRVHGGPAVLRADAELRRHPSAPASPHHLCEPEVGGRRGEQVLGACVLWCLLWRQLVPARPWP